MRWIIKLHTNFNILIKFGGKNVHIRLCSYVKTAYTTSPFTNTCPHCNFDVGKQNYCKNEECGKVIPSDEVLSAFVFSADDRKVIDKELLKDVKKQVSKIVIEGNRVKKDTRDTIGGSYILLRAFSKQELDIVGDVEDDSFYGYKLLQCAKSGEKKLVE